jgi:hypothetical protein
VQSGTSESRDRLSVACPGPSLTCGAVRQIGSPSPRRALRCRSAGLFGMSETPDTALAHLPAGAAELFQHPERECAHYDDSYDESYDHGITPLVRPIGSSQDVSARLRHGNSATNGAARATCSDLRVSRRTYQCGNSSASTRAAPASPCLAFSLIQALLDGAPGRS